MVEVATDPDRAKLIATLKALAAHLREYDEPTWTDEVNECRFLIEDVDARGVPRLLRVSGGAGSLSDLTLRVPHTDPSEPTALAANDRLHALLNEARALAEKLPTRK